MIWFLGSCCLSVPLVLGAVFYSARLWLCAYFPVGFTLGLVLIAIERRGDHDHSPNPNGMTVFCFLWPLAVPFMVFVAVVIEVKRLAFWEILAMEGCGCLKCCNKKWREWMDGRVKAAVSGAKPAPAPVPKSAVVERRGRQLILDD